MPFFHFHRLKIEALHKELIMSNASEAAAKQATKLAEQGKPLGNTYANAPDPVRKAAEAAWNKANK